MNKLYIYGFILILIVLGVWQYTSLVEENGKLEQSNATLEKTAEDWEKDYNKIKKVADVNADAVAKVATIKNNLISHNAQLAMELEDLKNENENVNKWAIAFMPSLLAYRLLDFSDNESEDRLSKSSEGSIKSNTRTEIEVRNENLYSYANELKSSIRSCNADKEGLRNWYNQVDKILQ